MRDLVSDLPEIEAPAMDAAATDAPAPFEHTAVLVVRVGNVRCCFPASSVLRVERADSATSMVQSPGGHAVPVGWLGRFWGLPRPDGLLPLVIGTAPTGPAAALVEEVEGLAHLPLEALPAHLGPLAGVVSVARSPDGPLLVMKLETPHAR